MKGKLGTNKNKKENQRMKGKFRKAMIQNLVDEAN